MPVLALTDPVTGGTVSSSVQIANQNAIKAIVNGGLDNANLSPAAGMLASQLAGYPASSSVFLDGSGAWSTPPTAVTYRKNTTTDVVNTVTNTDLLAGSITVAGNAMGANGILEIYAWGDYLNNTGSPQNITVALQHDSSGTTGVGTSVVASATRSGWFIQWFINNQNATNVQQWGGLIALPNGTNNPIFFNGATVDTTAGATITIKAQHGAANALLSMRLHGALVRVV